MLYTIYKIVCKSDSELVYVGSTKDYFSRISTHKHYAAKGNKAYKIYESINANGGWDNWECSIIENMESDDRKAVTLREAYFITSVPATLNMVIIKHTEEMHKEAMRKNHIQQKSTRTEEKKEAMKERRITKSKEPEEIARLKAYYSQEYVRERRNELKREHRAKARALIPVLTEEEEQKILDDRKKATAERSHKWYLNNTQLCKDRAAEFNKAKRETNKIV